MSELQEFKTARGATVPAGAKAAIVAELHEDNCDIQTDYFNVRTTRSIVIGWSTHTRDLFAEMRKHAATFPPTAHMGPGCDVWTVSIVVAADATDNHGQTYWKGHRSPWHGDVLGGESYDRSRTFTTEADARTWIAEQPATEPHPVSDITFEWQVSRTSIEHREKYSMGHGYYLKAGGAYSSGWTVTKREIYPGNNLSDWETFQPDAAPVKTPDAVPVDGVTVTPNADRQGIEIRFPAKPDGFTLARLKAHGWRWSRHSACWYNADRDDTRAFAAALQAPVAEPEPEPEPEPAPAPEYVPAHPERGETPLSERIIMARVRNADGADLAELRALRSELAGLTVRVARLIGRAEGGQ